MDQALLKALHDKSYEKRKVAALDIEKLVRESVAAKDEVKITNIITTLADLAQNNNNMVRSGGIMGLAGVSIALGFTHIPKHLALIVPPVLNSFVDMDPKVRYFACESMYNVAKVAKGEILLYFNELFDAMAKLAADTELPVKNGAELLDRLVKDVVTEQAATYISVVLEPLPSDQNTPQPQTAFSLPRFIPLLKERINVINPFTRMYLVSWLNVLDSVPEIELITYLPDFLEGLINFLGDPTTEIRTATQNVLADFLREIKEVAEVQQAQDKAWNLKKSHKDQDHDSPLPSHQPESISGPTDSSQKHSSPDPNASVTVSSPRPSFPDSGSPIIPDADEMSFNRPDTPNAQNERNGTGLWVPGQGVVVKYAEIVEILLKQMNINGPEADREIQAVCLRWIAEFLAFDRKVILPFTPQLIPLVMSALAHHVPSLKQAAHNLNVNLFQVISELPSPTSEPDGIKEVEEIQDGDATAPSTPLPFPTQQTPSRIPSLIDRNVSDRNLAARTDSPLQILEPVGATTESDPFDYQATVGALCTLLGVEEEESRLAALHWLSMLHNKAPKKILSLDDGTFPALLKTLSDPSEEVIKSDLQLLAQISSASSDEYFTSFMINLVRLFSTDRPLLELRGRTIVGQLCVSLNTERIYRTFAEILEKDEDLEFASLMVQDLNLFMITLPELADFRKRLKNIDTKDGSLLFTSLYRSWSHNAAATLALCFLAQAYEHASNLLQIFADLEMTVGLLIQIDKLVQLLESTVFTSLRLQLLEPEKYPYLLKALYGLLMLLPQSTAFVTLRNRLNSVSALGFLHAVPRATSTSTFSATTPSSTRSIVRRADDIKWQDLLAHFKSIQLKHERQRRNNVQQQHSHSTPNFSTIDADNASAYNFPNNSAFLNSNGTSTGKMNSRRRQATNTSGTVRSGSVTGDKRSSAGVGGAMRGSAKAPSVSSTSRPLSPPASAAAQSNAGQQRRVVSQNPSQSKK